MSQARSYDIGIAGAGVAGLAAATLLSWAGHRVTLLDQFPAPKAVGSGLMLQPTGLAILEAMGLASWIGTHGVRVDRLLGVSQPSGKTVLDVRYSALSGNRFALGVQRTALFEVLLAAAKNAGATIVSDTRIVSYRRALDGRIRIVTRWGQRSERFDLVVDALGSRSILCPEAGIEFEYGALWSTLDWPAQSALRPHSLEQRYEAAEKMVGVLPVGTNAFDPNAKAAFFWSLPVAAYQEWRKTPLDQWKSEVIALWPEVAPLLEQIVSHNQLVLGTYLHRTLRTPGRDRMVHIGDSYHATSPQLGQGANSALLDACALANSLSTTGTIEDALVAFQRRRHRHVRFYQAASWLATPVYQSQSQFLPALRDRVAGPISRIYPVPKLLAGLVSGGFGKPLAAVGVKAIKPPPVSANTEGSETEHSIAG